MARSPFAQALIYTVMILSCFAYNAIAAEAAFVKNDITDDLFLLKNAGGNIAVSKGVDGLLVVDNGNSADAHALKHFLDEFGGENSVKYIINTHWHDDHSGANNLLGKKAAIVAHDNVRKHLSKDHSIPLFNIHEKAFEPQGLPTLTYPQQMHIHFNHEKIELTYYANGHSDSDTLVYFTKANVVHMGDLMVYPMYPFIDLDSGGNALNYAHNIKLILAKIDNDTIVIPGHGNVTDKAGMEDFSRMLAGTIGEVQAFYSQSLSLDEAIARGLSNHWEKFSHSAITEATWIEEIYRSLAQNEQD